jgi:hypothetical protein
MRKPLIDDSRADDALDFAIARAEVAQWQLDRVQAERMAAIADVHDLARRHPEVFVVLRGEARPSDIAFAMEAATADLAVRLSLSEAVVVSLAGQAQTVRARAPRVWSQFREGEFSAENVRSLAQTLESMPVDVDADAQLETKALELAELVPARFRDRLRTLRERLHPEPLTQRHERARRDRRVCVEHERDAMAWFSVRLSAADAEIAWRRLDTIAEHLAGIEGETRTYDQLRSDAAADILTGRIDPETAPRVTVGVLVPVLTLLGESEQPASIEGRTPIDLDSARRLVAQAPSLFRVLTDPISGAVIDVDRRSYRPPADLARLLRLRDVTCRFAGCGCAAARCDLDHTHDWALGGATRADNLAHLSPRHHRLKHRTRWRVEQKPGGRITWTSPTGFVRDADPPPF